MDEIPKLINIDAETSMEIDGEEKLLKKVVTNASAYNTNKSLYNITFEKSYDQKHASAEFKDYESRLHQEMKDWKNLLHNAYKDLKQSKQKHPVVDKTILPPDKLEYLEKAESLQNFIRESVEFTQEAVTFLEYDYAEIMEALENLESLCEHKLNILKANKISENLANI